MYYALSTVKKAFTSLKYYVYASPISFPRPYLYIFSIGYTKSVFLSSLCKHYNHSKTIKKNTLIK
jgi:hypothetical protein